MLSFILYISFIIQYDIYTCTCIYVVTHYFTYILVYSGPSVIGRTQERTPLQKGHKFLAASTLNVCNAPSHLDQRTLLSL